MTTRYAIAKPSKKDLIAAWGYYEQHPDECDRAIAAIDQDGDG